MLLSRDGSLLLYVSPKTDVVDIPESVIRIGDYAVYVNDRINNLVVPDNVETIGIYAFSRCNSLRSVTLGCAVKEIEPYAFLFSDGIRTFTIKAKNPPKTPSYGSFSSDQFQATLVVPKGYIDAYKNSNYDWYKFRDIDDGSVKPEEVGPVSGNYYNIYADTPCCSSSRCVYNKIAKYTKEYRSKCV